MQITATTTAAPASGSQPSQASSIGRWVLAAVVLVGPLALCVVLRLRRLVVTSDSVAQQSVVQTWLHTGHARAYLPPDTWLLKLPVYVVVESLPFTPTVRLAIESITLDALGVVLLAAGLAILARRPPAGPRWSDAVLPLAWVGTVAGGLGQYLAVMPNSRNIELGLGLCLVAAAAVHLRRVRAPVVRPTRPGARSRPRAILRTVATAVLLGAGAVLGAALLWVDDPYVADLIGLPLAIACLAWFLVRDRDRRLLHVTGLLVLSLAAIPVVRAALARVGVVDVPDATGVTLSPHQILSHLPILWPSLVAQTGLDEPGDVAAVVHVLVLAVLIVAVAAAGWVTWYGWRRRDLALTFVGAHWPVVVVGVLLDRTIYDFHAGRYLVLAVFDLAVCLGLAAALARPRAPRVAAAIGVLAAVGAVANLIGAVADPTSRPALAEQQAQTLTVIRGTGATKGFSDFWAADLLTQQSGGRLLVSDVVCSGGRLRLRHWLTDSARVSAAARQTFVLWDPAAGYGRGCPLAVVERQLGAASRRVPAPTGGVVLVFDRDVSHLIDPA